MARNTRTGAVLESMILPSLKQGGYIYRVGVNIGSRLGGGSHLVDVVAEKGSFQYLVSLKWQQVSGTAEQKIPFEVLCLMDAIQTNQGKYAKAYLVLGGPGWKLRKFYIEGGLNQYLKHDEYVKLMDLEHFAALANTGRL